jgi:hypothetical protein
MFMMMYTLEHAKLCDSQVLISKLLHAACRILQRRTSHPAHMQQKRNHFGRAAVGGQIARLHGYGTLLRRVLGTSHMIWRRFALGKSGCLTAARGGPGPRVG